MVGLTLEQKDAWARKAIAMGRGGPTYVGKQAKVSKSSVYAWMEHLREREGEQKTIVSSPTSRVQSKPNGSATPTLPPFLQGLDEYINQIVDARVEAKLVEILKTKSLMELMKG